MLNVPEYFEKFKALHNFMLNYIQCDQNSEENFVNLMIFFDEQQIANDRHDLRSSLYLIVKISQNHNRDPHFFDKISQFLIKISQNIKNLFTNNEIFDIFKSSKRLLLILIEQKIIYINADIVNYLNKNRKYEDQKYFEYFYPELKAFIKTTEIKEEEEDVQSDFEDKRKLGENDNYICELIRKDLIDEFISYVSQNDFPIQSRIQMSIFETNSFLLKNKNPSLIEYSAFFGSVQIFKYLYSNGCELSPSLWLYSIHSQNPEMISLLIDYAIKPRDNSYEECLKEAIKCHHNDVANYIINNFIDDKKASYKIENNYDENIYSYSYHYYNLSFIPSKLESKFIFFYVCEYDYYKLCEYLIETREINLENKVV